VKRSPRSFILVLGAGAALFPSACSNKIVEPPPLGDCIPTGDASCKSAANVGGGGGSLSHGDAGAQLDAGTQSDGFTGTSDAGSCGEADVLIASGTQNVSCLPCIVGAPAAGALNCCMADAACSNDAGCLAIVQCALQQCSGNAACVGSTCEGLSSPQSVQSYNAFGGCLARYCSPQCPSLPQG
jgi:hypothetical protein